MVKTVYKSVVVTGLLTIILCGFYPLLVFGLGQLFFPSKANGSLVSKDGKTVGSSLIGQGFTKPEYFHGRPSAAGEKGYDATSSSGSNLGPTSAKLAKAVESKVKAVLGENPDLKSGAVPVDLVTSSGSGLDPHVSPEGAYVQAERVAKARGIPVETVKALIAAHTEQRQLGFLGEPVVNVLLLNLDLDARGKKQ